MLETIPTQAPPTTTGARLEIIAVFAKLKGGASYQVEMNYKVSDRFILRPISGKPYQWITATAEQLQDKKLFSLHPHFRLV